MDKKAICFIWNVKNESDFQLSAQYVKRLCVPDGYNIELKVFQEKSYAKAYNMAMKNNSAQYKVYIKDTTKIVNKNFLIQMIDLFLDSSIGMVGVLGSASIPTTGYWRDSRNKVGKIYNVDGVTLSFNNDSVTNKWTKVQLLDGILIATQYDILWREELFYDEYFFDAAQCVEFSQKGYQIAIPSQESPNCIAMGNCNKEKVEFRIGRDAFLKEYSWKIFPMVSILIPAYNKPDFFEIALRSALQQTYENIEILVGDDSTNDLIKRKIEPYVSMHKNLYYFNNGGPLGGSGYRNIERLLANCNGEYINILLDDDVFHPEKIRLMMEYYLECDGISLVTSRRQLIDETGAIMPDISASKPIVSQTALIEGRKLGRYIVKSFLNVIGEFTTVLMRKSDIDGMTGVYLNRKYKSSGDITQWLELLRKGNAIYISDTLSYFRQHNGQNSNNVLLTVEALTDNFQYIVDSYLYGCYIENMDEYLSILRDWLEWSDNILRRRNAYVNPDVVKSAKFELYVQFVKKAKEILQIDY